VPLAPQHSSCRGHYLPDTTFSRAAAALNHPNIVRLYDLGDHDGTPFMVMERLPGNTLGDQIAHSIPADQRA
jgi:serine/threonine protein kinase